MGLGVAAGVLGLLPGSGLAAGPWCGGVDSIGGSDCRSPG